MAGSEIVKVDGAAQLRHCRDVAHDHVMFGAGDHGFQNLDAKTTWLQTETVDFPFQLLDEAGIAQLCR
jgi:hypothetical protein